MPEASESAHGDLEEPYHLDPGTCYLIKGKASDTSYRLLEHLVSQGSPGLCLTRIYPEKVQARHRLPSVVLGWISHSPGDSCYDPTAIGTIAKTIEEFIDNHPQGCFILLDGIEFITNNLGFMKTLFFVEHVNEYVMPRQAIVLVPVDPDCFEPLDFARLDRFLESVDEADVRKALDVYALNRRLLDR
ncbi:MAG TPA: DUF835 domain-containing protein [Thermoplasmata archaeon]|jgi:two-component system cell cycle response regulator